MKIPSFQKQGVTLNNVIMQLVTCKLRRTCSIMSDGYIVDSLEGGELESDKERKFTISYLSSLTGNTVSGLKYLYELPLSRCPG